MEMLYQVICLFFCSLGFALVFNIRGRSVLPAALGGVLGWGVYLLVEAAGGGAFLPALLSSAALTVYAEIMARIRKPPATVYLLSGAIPMFHGSTLYAAMCCAVEADWPAFFSKGLETLLVAIGIATGMICATTAVRIVLRAGRQVK